MFFTHFIIFAITLVRRLYIPSNFPSYCLLTTSYLKEFRERAVQLAQRKDGNPVHFVEACPTDAAGDGDAEDKGKGKGNCSPLHSPSNGSGNGHGHDNVSSHGTDRLNEGLPDMAEEKEMDRDRDGRFVPRDNNIEDVNMNMVGAKSGDKSVDAPTAKEASPSSRSGSKMEASCEGRTFASDEHGREESQAATEGLGALTILAPRGMYGYCIVFTSYSLSVDIAGTAMEDYLQRYYLG